MPKAAPTHRPGAPGRARKTAPPPVPPTNPHPHVAAAAAYVDDVLTGRRSACKWVKAACRRHRADLVRAAKGWLYTFDPEKAERVCRFVELLPHIRGIWARKKPGEPKAHLLQLAPFQCFIVTVLFGWVRVADGRRRFRLAYICMPRKMGKSALVAALGLYMLCADGEMGAEVYSGAVTEKQALEVFGPARIMAATTPALLAHYGVEVNAANINILASASKFEPLIGKPGDGASPSCAIHDEYHEHQGSDQFDTMLTGMGSRQQPMQLVITTAGDNTAGPCYDLQLTIQQILEGLTEDEEKFGIIYTVDAEDDWTSPDVLAKANPNIDVSVSTEFLRSRQIEAARNPREQQRFKVKHLCMWVGARAGYFDMLRWAECGDPALNIDDYLGRPCHIGLDLASKVDIAAMVALFPPLDAGDKWAMIARSYLPEATVELGENEHYRGWLNSNPPAIVQTDGDITDYERIRDDILDLTGRFQVEDVAYDPHQATMLVTELGREGVPCVEFRPTVLNFSEPMKQIAALIRARQIVHDGDPCMAWMMGNVVSKTDRKDNDYPNKERPEKKIDGPVALISAMGRAMAGDGAPPSSYETERLFVI